MAKRKQGGTPKPAKPKPICEARLIVHDGGELTADFYVWEHNEVGARKKWTVSGADFFQFLNKLQPNTVPVVCSLFNVQIVNAGLPEDRQGPWLKRDSSGKLAISENSPGGAVAQAALPPPEDEVPTGQGPGSEGAGVALASSHEAAAQEAIDAGA